MSYCGDTGAEAPTGFMTAYGHRQTDEAITYSRHLREREAELRAEGR